MDNFRDAWKWNEPAIASGAAAMLSLTDPVQALTLVSSDANIQDHCGCACKGRGGGIKFANCEACRRGPERVVRAAVGRWRGGGEAAVGTAFGELTNKQTCSPPAPLALPPPPPAAPAHIIRLNA
ncbi:unnamed protein product, partial [Iphiclides podalirius]